MNLSRKYRKSRKKQSKLYTVVALLDIVVLAASFIVILNAV